MADQWEGAISLPATGQYPKTKPYGAVPGASVNGAIGAASVRLTLPSGALFARIAAGGDCHVIFGDNAVVATTSHMLFPSGAEVFGVPAGATHIAFIQSLASTGVFSVTELL